MQTFRIGTTTRDGLSLNSVLFFSILVCKGASPQKAPAKTWHIVLQLAAY